MLAARILLWSPVAVLAAVPFLPSSAIAALVGLFPGATILFWFLGLHCLFAGVAGWHVVRHGPRRLWGAALAGSAVAATPFIALPSVYFVLAVVLFPEQAELPVSGEYLLAIGISGLLGAGPGWLGGKAAMRARLREAI